MLQIRRILYPTDFSKSAHQALDHALYLAESFEAELHLLHAVVLHEADPTDPERRFPEPSDILSRLFEIADSEMARIAHANQARTFTLVEAKEKGFAAGEVILDYAKEKKIDLIVMGTHGRRGPARLFLGSVAEEVVRHCDCPVMTMRQREEAPSGRAIERILVPVDFSEHSQQALFHARELANLYGSRLQVLHAIEEPVYPYFYAPAGGFSVAKQLEELREKSDQAMDALIEETQGPAVEVEKFVATGRAANEIVRFAADNRSDLIVIATHGLSGLERLLVGSTTEQVVRTSPCPVFTVKSYGRSLVAGV